MADSDQFDQDPGQDYSQFDNQNGENFDESGQYESGEPMSMEQGQEQQGGEDGTTGGVDDDGSEDDRKLFVGGLSWETTAKDLKDYFTKFGEVTNTTLKTDVETKRSRGFGFVLFADAKSVDKVLESSEHKLHGRNIDPKRANPRAGIKKIFVGRLDPAVPETDIKAYFAKFGPVEKVELPYDKMKDQRRAFCFVEFEAEDAVKKVIDQPKHLIGGQEVDIKKATPTAAGRGRGRGAWGPGSWGGYGGRGAGGRGRGRGGWNQGGWGQGSGYGGYGSQGYYNNYGQGYGGYGSYGGYGNYGSDYYGQGYGSGGWGSYDQGYGGYGYGDYYGGWGYGQDQGQQQGSYGKTQKRGGHGGGYHPYSR